VAVSNTQFDIIIAGGGLSGAMAALSLAQLTQSSGKKLSIAIIEANPILTDTNLTFDSRVLALSHGSARYLKTIGVWPLLANDASPIDTIHVSDRGFYGKARITAQEHQVAALGYVIEMSLIGKALITQLKSLANISWFCPDTIENVQWQADYVEVLLASTESIQGKLLLGCDGAQSACRQFANIQSTTKSYQQSALIANVNMTKAHNNRAFERFTATGPIAMLPLTDTSHDSKRCSLVWTLTPQQAHEFVALSDVEFKVALEQSFGSWLGGVEQVGRRDVFPLNLVQANEQVFHRMVLIGNASHAVHPIAGQGFNLGLRDVQQLTEVIKTALAKQQDIGQFSLLSDYAAQRKADHQQVISITDSLVTLFSNQLLPLVAGRNIGLKAMNYFKPLKNRLVNKLMGY